MNYKVAKTMLVLCVVYLIGFYVLKFAFPELLLQTITSPTMLKFGEFVETWIGYQYILFSICNIISFYLFVSASCGNFKAKKKKVISVLVAVVVNYTISEFLPELYTHTSISIMFLLALINNGSIFNTVITFVIHGYLSQFLLSIRGFETIITQASSIGTISAVIMGTEIYVWLAMLCIIFYFKEKKENGRSSTSVSEQTHGTIKEELGNG